MVLWGVSMKKRSSFRQVSVDQFNTQASCGVVPMQVFSLEHRYGDKFRERHELAMRCLREVSK